MRERAATIASRYDVELPERLTRFYRQDQIPRRKLILEVGFVRGTFEVDGDSDDLLDIEALCEAQLIDELEPEHWADEFADYVPLLLLTDHFADEDSLPVGSFLVVDVSNAECPVLLWSKEGWSLCPLSASLDDFLAGLATGERGENWRMKAPYEKFRWE